jgi:hypothetical protein
MSLWITDCNDVKTLENGVCDCWSGLVYTGRDAGTVFGFGFRSSLDICDRKRVMYVLYVLDVL